VRHIALVVLALTATAQAEDEDPYFASFRTLSLAAGVSYHHGLVDGRVEVGADGVVDLAMGRGRWQYVASGSLGTTALQRTETTGVHGMHTHGALGTRWLARQFIPADQLAVELYLHGAAGVEHERYMDERVTRPDLDLGFALAVRRLRRPGVFARFDIDAVFAEGSPGVAAGMVLGW
jgi:hypothetical protein